MLKESDLRKGNLVWACGDAAEIVTIEEGCCKVRFLVYMSERPQEAIIDIADIEGLALTEDWLLDAGCNKADATDRFGGWFLPKIDNVQYRIKNGEWYATNGFRKNGFYATLDRIIELEFVHQVQNLYHVLSGGKELTTQK